MRGPAHGQRRLGMGMAFAAAVLALGLLTLLFDGALEDIRNPNARPQGQVGAGGVREVVLKDDRQGHFVAEGLVNGRPVRFLVDTGASLVSFPAGLARRLGLEPGRPQASRTAGGPVTTYATRLDRLRLGNIVRQDVRASINPRMDGDIALLGMSFLRGLEIIQRDGRMILRQHPGD